MIINFNGLIHVHVCGQASRTKVVANLNFESCSLKIVCRRFVSFNSLQMAAVVRQCAAFLEQALVGSRMFGNGYVLDVLDEIAGDMRRAKEAIAEQWLVREEAMDEYSRVERGKALRPMKLGTAASRDLAAMHEVVKRLRRRQYKDGWRIEIKLRVVPEFWSLLRPQFYAAGAEVAQQGNRGVVSFVSGESVLLVLRALLKVGRGMREKMVCL